MTRIQSIRNSTAKSRAVQFALAHLRASGGASVDAAAFARSLNSGTIEPSVRDALETHLREAEPAELADLVAEGATTLDNLAALAADLIEADHPNAAYLHDTMSGRRPRLHGGMDRRHGHSRWAELMTLALPALEHAMPGEAGRLASGMLPRWSLGGGTALASRLGHRASDGIDVFVCGIPLAELTPSRNPFARAIDPHPQWPGHWVRYERGEGEIAFTSSALQTSPGFTLETFNGRIIAVETPAEVMVKAIRYRAAQFTPRDAFDLACVIEDQPEIIAAIARETADALPRLMAALDVVGKKGDGAVGSQVRPEPTHSHLMTDTVNRARAGVSRAMALAADPITSDAAAAMREAVHSISWFEPGTDVMEGSPETPLSAATGRNRLDATLMRLSARYCWDSSPDKAPSESDRVILRAFNVATWDDTLELERVAGPSLLREALSRATAGALTPRAWSFWHYRLGLSDFGEAPPPQPARTLR